MLYLQLIQDSLLIFIKNNMDGSMSLIEKIAAVHVVYRESSKYIDCFGQLTSYSPGILDSFVNKTADQVDCMVRQWIC